MKVLQFPAFLVRHWSSQKLWRYLRLVLEIHQAMRVSYWVWAISVTRGSIRVFLLSSDVTNIDTIDLVIVISHPVFAHVLLYGSQYWMRERLNPALGHLWQIQALIAPLGVELWLYIHIINSTTILRAILIAQVVVGLYSASRFKFPNLAVHLWLLYPHRSIPWLFMNCAPMSLDVLSCHCVRLFHDFLKDVP